MKKLFICAAMALIIGVGGVTVAEAHPGTKGQFCGEAGDGHKWKHTACESGTGGKEHKHQCASNNTGWIKSDHSCG